MAEKEEALIRWEAPHEGWTLLNTDDASSSVLRGARGEWIQGLTEHFGICTSVKAKPRAALCGLKMARELGLKKVWLWADSMVVVGMLRGNGNWNLVNKQLIIQCKQLIEWTDWEVKITHCYREANQVVDKLANLGINNEIGIVYFNFPPTEVLDMFHADLV